MTSKQRFLFWTYVLLAVVAPVSALLYLQYQSIVRQRRTIRELTAANLRLSGEQIAAKLERAYYESAQVLLHQYSGMRELPARASVALPVSEDRAGCRIAADFDRLFLIQPDGSATTICGAAGDMWSSAYTPLLQSDEPGKVFPLGIAGPAPAQFFYVEDAHGRYWVVSVDLRYSSGDRKADAQVLGIMNQARVVMADAPKKQSEILVPFPTLFPFWRIAVSPPGPLGKADNDVLTFAALTSVILFLLAFALVLFTRASWRNWRLSQVREEFVQGVSHDLRAPVSNISMYSEMLMRGDFPPERTREVHEIIFQQAQRLSGLVMRVLEISKMKRAPKSVALPASDPASIVLEAVRTVQARADSRSFQIDVIQPGMLPQVHCDREGILQCLLELLENAIKYSGDSRRIEVRLAVRGAALRIAVRDYGIGIPDSEIPYIFNQFYRGAKARDQQGYGLGLHLVKTIMDAHHGRVEISSIVNQGSEFCLILPL